ncbi:MAG: response regulator [Deltaproteobacteria bacterium]|nr:response regulator [Deltaproteobacteria bacterium]
MRKIRILIVDDDKANVKLLSAKLEADGYEMDSAYNGIEALQRVEGFNPDIILLDIMMPKMDGYEVCRRLKASEKTKYIPIVMLTARGEIEDKVLGFDIGAEEYLSKPCSLVELSARVRSLLHVRMLQTQLTEMEKLAALGRMVDGISHEVRNPLMVIGGMARRIKEKTTTDEQLQSHINLIIHQIERLERMIERIDEFKNIQASEMKEENVNEVIIEAVNDIKDIAKAKTIDIRLSLMPAPPLLMIDKANLKKALLNILQNSIEAIAKKGEIEIKTIPYGRSYLELIIRDTGCGIKREELKNIFNPFYTSKMAGAGLGLTIVYKVTQDHKADIAVESEEGKGTVVSIKFHF